VASIPQRDLRQVQSMNAFFITPAISGVGLRTITSTHPSLEQRLEQLAKVAAELGKPMDGGFQAPDPGLGL
jgi:heat shock protein HtpX